MKARSVEPRARTPVMTAAAAGPEIEKLTAFDFRAVAQSNYLRQRFGIQRELAAVMATHIFGGAA